jgi:hypothetical protein
MQLRPLHCSTSTQEGVLSPTTLPFIARAAGISPVRGPAMQLSPLHCSTNPQEGMLGQTTLP